MAALVHHERALELDDDFAVLIKTNRLTRTIPTFGRDWDSRFSSTSLRE